MAFEAVRDLTGLGTALFVASAQNQSLAANASAFLQPTNSFFVTILTVVLINKSTDGVMEIDYNDGTQQVFAGTATASSVNATALLAGATSTNLVFEVIRNTSPTTASIYMYAGYNLVTDATG